MDSRAPLDGPSIRRLCNAHEKGREPSASRAPALEPVQSLPEISDHMEMRARYPSDISREQFEQIRALLEGARKKT
ncbi:hypothetical protein LYZ92_20665, partial [Xanthomonas hortorum pv. taraxaci]|nr:hypothetical protein [Xanthomonas hortorum pv. taraxaci]